MNQAFLPASQLRPCQLISAASGSLVYSSDMGSTVFLVGSGDTPYVIILASSEEDLPAGSAWLQKQTNSWSGLEVGKLHIRVDALSRIPPKTGRPALSILRSANRLYLNCRPPEPNGQRIMAEIADDLPTGWGDMIEVFTRWQLVAIDDGKEVVVHTVDVTPNQTPAR